ncbi:hypothetical protein C8Q76DRAFT_22539 [Earliella scabrosa]|nr:hypothetical protein C8Q76DRAFT_22539 [Earliella scabrosa]
MHALRARRRSRTVSRPLAQMRRAIRVWLSAYSPSLSLSAAHTATCASVLAVSLSGTRPLSSQQDARALASLSQHAAALPSAPGRISRPVKIALVLNTPQPPYWRTLVPSRTHIFFRILPTPSSGIHQHGVCTRHEELTARRATQPSSCVFVPKTDSPAIWIQPRPEQPEIATPACDVRSRAPVDPVWTTHHGSQLCTHLGQRPELTYGLAHTHPNRASTRASAGSDSPGRCMGPDPRAVPLPVQRPSGVASRLGRCRLRAAPPKTASSCEQSRRASTHVERRLDSTGHSTRRVMGSDHRRSRGVRAEAHADPGPTCIAVPTAPRQHIRRPWLHNRTARRARCGAPSARRTSRDRTGTAVTH